MSNNKGAKYVDPQKTAEDGLKKRMRQSATYRDQQRQKALWNSRLPPSDNKELDFPTEMEHAIGYAAASDSKRKATPLARKAESDMAAYHEDKNRHRAHIGTGKKGLDGDVAFSSNSYRDSQRTLLLDSNGATAIQLNQAAYALQERNHATGTNPFQHNTPSMNEADSHFVDMANNMPEFVSVSHGTQQGFPVSEADRRSMTLARLAARTGKWPTEEINKWNAANTNLVKSQS